MQIENQEESIGVVFIGADHGGFELKEVVKPWLEQQGWLVTDVGANTYNPTDDYPNIALDVATQVAAQQSSSPVSPESPLKQKSEQKPVRGILFCRSGGGMSIAANKVKGIRSLPVYTQEQVVRAVEDDHVQVISLAGDWLTSTQAKELITTFLATKPSVAERHQRRVAQIVAFENAP